ncbi:hypothetical protein CYY_009493 [Polysphondylium violaceum]|uniref:ABC transporter domain-containing protein n=1 Tax=Polysphondylium violaceum TaxID=133409 RepID=A0A8J4PLQ3_9MYCE|nr:hypothetical protein CYY_009493 [Polysphondylium violaceum]
MAPKGKKKGQQFDSDEEINNKNNKKTVTPPAADSDEDIPQPTKKGGKNKKNNNNNDEEDVPQPVKKGNNKKGAKGKHQDSDEEDQVPQPVKKGNNSKGGKGKQQQDSEDEQEDVPQPVKKGGNNNKKDNKKGGKGKQVESESEEEEEEVPQPVKKGNNKKDNKKAGKGKGKQVESEEEEEEEEELPQPVKKGNKKDNKKGGKGKQIESEDEEEEVPQPVKKGNKKDNKKGGKGKQVESEEEEEEEEVPQPVKKGNNKKDNKKGGKGKGKQVESEEEEEEEEEVPQPVKKGSKKDNKKAGKGKGKQVESEEEEEEEEEKPKKKSGKGKGKKVESEPEEEEEEEEKPKKKSGKKDQLEDKMSKLSIKKGKKQEEEEEEEEEEQQEEEEEEKEEEPEKRMTLAEMKAAKKAKKAQKIEAKKEKAKKKAAEDEEDEFELAKKKAAVEIDYDNVDIDDVPGREPPEYVHLKSGEGLRSKIGNDIKFDNLTLSVPGKILLNNASLTLAYGHKYGFVGRNGIGKSTLVKKIAMRDEITIAPHLRVLYVEQEVTGDDNTPIECVLAADLERAWLIAEEKVLVELEKNNPSWMFDPREKRNYNLRDIYDRLKEIDSDKAIVRASNILVGLGFTMEEISVKKSKDYSGGWRMRIALARALFCKPEVLLLDEPSNHLDLHACVWLEKYLNQWDRTLLVVSHEASFLNEVVDNIIHIHDQRLTQYKGNWDAFQKQRVVTQKTLASQKDKQDRKIKKMNEFITKNKNNTQAGTAASRKKQLDKIERIEIEREDAGLIVDFPEPEHLQPPLLVFHQVNFGYENRPLMFKNLEIGVDMDMKVALVGMNGVGKSTLMKLMAGELHESSGYVERSRKCRIARFSQHFVDQLDVAVSSIEYFQNKFSNPPIQAIRNHLGRFGINGSLPLHKINTLSGGQKSRVILAELAWAEPHILLLDEPTNHLDIDAIEALAEGINAYPGGVVLISHNQHLINLVTDQIWVVKKDGSVTKYDGDFMDYKAEISKEIDSMVVRS